MLFDYFFKIVSALFAFSRKKGIQTFRSFKYKMPLTDMVIDNYNAPNELYDLSADPAELLTAMSAIELFAWKRSLVTSRWCFRTS